MKKINPAIKALTLIFSIVLTIMILPLPISADTGPKPSVEITFENLGSDVCYGTLLSEENSSGPFSVWNGKEEDAKCNMPDDAYPEYVLDYDDWKAFVDYADSDGFYFLQQAWEISKTKSISWTYYPPESFKILIYFPDTKHFAVSDVCERYAFDSYFTVNMDGTSLLAEYNEELSSNEKLDAYEAYNYGAEIASLAARILITIIVETGVALLFGYREKKQLLLLIGMNTVTQIILNLLLNLVNYKTQDSLYIVLYLLAELLVVALEATALLLLLNKLSVKPKKRLWMVVYAVVANSASFFTGVILVSFLPDIF